MYQDKLGCYRVGDLKVYSKLEAIELHTKTGIHPHWDFNEAVFSSYDWTVEPTENILELYRQRAQQLRDKYDYIVLMYSGGADSTNILDSFVNNNIQLDEIVSYINYDTRDSYLNSEIFKAAVPMLEKLKATCPWIKHRLLDMTQLTLDYFSRDDTKFNWIYDLNMYFSPNNASRESLPLKIKDWADIIHRGKKLCVLWGHDKPRIHHVNGRFSMRFIDFVDSGPTVKSIAGRQPYFDELFYWTPDKPEIVIKQAHLIKNYLSQIDLATMPFISEVRSDLAWREIDGKKYWLSNHGLHRLIYPTWNIDTFSNGKVASLILTPRDEWFFNIEDTNKLKRNLLFGFEKFWQIIPDYWMNDPTQKHKSIKACWSKDYYLEK